MRQHKMMKIYCALLSALTLCLLSLPVRASTPDELSAPPDTVPPCYVPAPPQVVSIDAWVPARQTRARAAKPQPEGRRPILIVLSSGANVRSGPSTFYTTQGTLGWRTEHTVTGRYGRWWRIAYQGTDGWVYDSVVNVHHADCVNEVTLGYTVIDPSPYPITPPAAPSEITEARWIDVNLTEQRVTAYEHGIPVHSYLVSTGLPRTPTPEGQFRIWLKLRYDDMEGDDYFLPNVPYVMYFYQGYGFHGVWWHANFGHRMSHGCVNQPNTQAAWLFNWAEVGTLVNVHQ